MKLEWIVLCEGLGQSASGAFTLIGVNQNVFAAPTLPAVTKRAILAHISVPNADAFVGNLSFGLQIVAPNGQVILATTGTLPIRDLPVLFPELPVTLDIPAEAPINITEYGGYKIRLEAEGPGDTHISGEVLLYVVAPPT